MNSLARSVAPKPPEAGGAPGRVLAIDYGRRRIGLAVSDELRVTAQPLVTLERENRAADLRRLREIARRQSARLIVVGLPLHLDGRVSEMAEEARRFAACIQKATGIPVELVDERLTSWEAAQTLGEMDGRSRVRKAATHVPRHVSRTRRRTPRRADGRSRTRRAIDDIAAAVLLREYLERQHPTAAALRPDED